MSQKGLKTAAMSALFNTSTVAAATQTVNTVVQQASTAPNAPHSLSAVATAITSFIFGECRLPFNLCSYGPLISTLVSSAGSIAIWRYFDRKRQSRARVHLAVFHIVRLIERNEELRDLLDEPEQLLEVISLEVEDLVSRHISEQEGERVLKVLKRRVEARKSTGERATQRRRTEDERGTQIIESSAQEETSVEDESSLQDVSMVDVQNLTPPTSEEESQPAGTQRITVTRSPQSLRVSSQERSAGTPAVSKPSRNFGFTYADFSDSSSSGKNSPTEEIEPPRAVKRASLYQSTAVGPRSPFGRTPPTAIATRYAETGTDLSPIEEGNSVSSSASRRRSYPRVVPPAVRQQSQQQEEFPDLGWESPIIDYSPDTDSYLSSSADEQTPVMSTTAPSASRRSAAVAARSSPRSPVFKRASPAVVSSSAPKTPSPARKRRGRPPKASRQKQALPAVTPSRHSARKGKYKGSYKE